jgi:transposase-like protein
MGELARRLGVTAESVYRWRDRGLTVWAADRAACRAGFHPAIVWPEWATASKRG